MAERERDGSAGWVDDPAAEGRALGALLLPGEAEAAGSVVVQ